MKRIRVNLDKISDRDLQLAKNPRAIAFLDEVIPLSLEERAQKLHVLQQKIDSGEADLFEEHVKSRLLDHRSAEWIRIIYKNLPEIEQELEKRRPSGNSSSSELPSSPPPETSETSRHRQPAPQTHSELLDFLATQTPPKPPVSNSPRGKTINIEEKAPLFSLKELAVIGLLCAVLAVSIGFVAFSRNESSEELLTFRDQEMRNSPEARQARLLDEQLQEEFDAAAQELRFGDFESGKAQLLDLAERFPTSVHAENACVLVADTARLRKRDAKLALETYQSFLERWPESSKAGLVQLKMGFTYEDLEDFSSAEAAYRLLIATAGENSRLGQLAKERLLRLQEQTS